MRRIRNAEKVEKLAEDDKIKNAYQKKKADAEPIIEDQDRLENFLENLEDKLAKVPTVGKYLSDVPTLISLLRAYKNRTYRRIPKATLLAVGGILLYWLMPVDLIPDFIPGVGFLDDAAVFAFAYKKIHGDIETYKEWRTNKKNTINE